MQTLYYLFFDLWRAETKTDVCGCDVALFDPWGKRRKLLRIFEGVYFSCFVGSVAFLACFLSACRDNGLSVGRKSTANESSGD